MALLGAMSGTHVCMYILTLILFVIPGSHQAGTAVEKALLDDLFTDYDTDALPRAYADDRVIISAMLSIDHIIEVDERSQKLSVIAQVTLTWLDVFLRWNTTKYNDVKEVEVPVSRAWHPQVSLLNSADAFIQENIGDVRCIIHYDGTVVWTYGGAYTTYCAIDVFLYPFDRQTCHIELGITTRSSDKVSFALPFRRALFQSGSGFSEEASAAMWKVESSSAHVQNRGIGINLYSLADFEIYLKRDGIYTLINVLLPCIFLAILTLLIPWLPAESGERVGLGITCFLAYSVYMVIIDDKMPSQTATMPLLQVYLLCMMILTAVMVVVSIFSLMLYHHDPKVKPPKVALRCIKVCFRPFCKKPHTSTEEDLQSRQLDYLPHDTNGYLPRRRRIRSRMVNGQLDYLNGKTYTSSDDLTKHEHSKQQLTDSDGNEDGDFSLEWSRLSRLLDMMSFWFALVIMLGLTLALLIMAPVMSTMKAPVKPASVNTSEGIVFLGGGNPAGGQIDQPPEASGVKDRRPTPPPGVPPPAGMATPPGFSMPTGSLPPGATPPTPQPGQSPSG